MMEKARSSRHLVRLFVRGLCPPEEHRMFTWVLSSQIRSNSRAALSPDREPTVNPMLMLRSQGAARSTVGGESVYHVSYGSVMSPHQVPAPQTSSPRLQVLSQGSVYSPAYRQVASSRSRKHHLAGLAPIQTNPQPSPKLQSVPVAPLQRTPSGRDMSPRVVHVSRNSPRMSPADSPQASPVLGPQGSQRRLSVTMPSLDKPGLQRSSSRQSLRGAGVSVLLEHMQQQSFRAQPSPRRSYTGRNDVLIPLDFAYILCS
jgi:hypothetical protein